jgi:hypothetical protein
MNVNEIALVICMFVLCIGSIELGKMHRNISILMLVSRKHDEDIEKLKKEADRG